MGKIFAIIVVLAIIVYAGYCVFGTCFATTNISNFDENGILHETFITETKIEETILPEIITWDNAQVQRWD